MEEKTIDTSNEKITSFAKYRGRLRDLYSTERDIKNRTGSTYTLSALSKVKSQDAQELFNSAISNPSDAAAISEAAMYMSNAYASIINYYKTLFYIRYTVTPRLVKREEDKIGQDKEEYAKIYYRMMDVVEGLCLETTLPAIAEEALIKGSCGIVTEKFQSSESIITFFLPTDRFKTIGKTQFGTNIIAFDFKYFDDLKTSTQSSGSSTVADTTFETIMASMPKILQQGYNQYLSNTTTMRWQALDPKVATAFTFNEMGLPPRLGAYPASVDYNSYKDIKLDNAAQNLDHILTHQIPTNSDGDLIMDPDEAIDIAQNMRATLKSMPNVKVVTTFGKSELHDLQKDISEQADMLNSAYNNIYNSAGVDYHIFISDADLAASINRDKAFMWDFYNKVMLFFNITTNNIINFNPYQCRINLIPITTQYEKEDIGRIIENAGAGIGRLQAVVSTGLKQVDIGDNSKLEEFLKLDTILKPLQSMYTSSYRVNEKNKTDSDSDKEASSNDAAANDEQVNKKEKEDSSSEEAVGD